MTTIAWDGKTLSSDSHALAEGIVCAAHEQKIFAAPAEGWFVFGERVQAIGCAGDCGAEMELRDVLLVSLTYASTFHSTSEFAAIAVVRKDRAYVICKDRGETHARIFSQSEPYAIGSGGVIARTAMYCGKSSREAVAIAIELDCFSGGEVATLSAVYFEGKIAVKK